MESQPKKKKLALLEDSDDEGDGGVPSPLEHQITSEITKYCALPKEDVSSDPLAWWATHVNQFPLLSRVARKYLLSHASGYLVTRNRSRLTGKRVDDLLILHGYYRNAKKEGGVACSADTTDSHTE